MFAGYKLELSTDYQRFVEFESLGKNHLKEYKADYIKSLEKYALNGITDITSLTEDNFPQVDAEVFISHSHKDEKLALGIAGWLNHNFGLKCFIDSTVWNYSAELLEEINKSYSDRRRNGEGGYTYNHEKCNIASQHVNMMLTTALHKMIDKTEMILLLNTPNSIFAYEDVYKDATYSPWIYSEIVCSQIVRKKDLSEYRNVLLLEKSLSHSFEMSSFRGVYEVNIDHLSELNLEMMIEWKQEYEKEKWTYPLDLLYMKTSEFKENECLKRYIQKYNENKSYAF